MTREEIIKSMTPEQFDLLQKAEFAKFERIFRQKQIDRLPRLMRQERAIRQAGIAQAIENPEQVDQIAERTAMLLKPLVQKRRQIEKATGVTYSEDSL